jgi:hypothetical protein
MRIISKRYSALVAIFFALIVGAGEDLARASPRSTVDFRPGVTKLSDPTTSGAKQLPSKFTLNVLAYNASGSVINPTPDLPIRINVYGAPDGVITPVSTTITKGRFVTFSYNGQFFPNPITIEAYVSNGTGGQAIGVTQILPKNRLGCVYGMESVTIPFDCGGQPDPACADSNVTNGLKLFAAVGYNSPTAGNLTDFTVDTGSLGVVVPAKELGPDAIGPAGPGVKFYDSSGNTYAGYYYLARVSFGITSGAITTIVQTNPIKVLGIVKAYCAPGYSKCDKNPPSPNLHYLGVGFDRNNTTVDDSFDSPADNPFLQLTDSSNGTDLSPGYVLTDDGATVGITGTAGFNLVVLAPDKQIPGDWITTPGCYGFPELQGTNQFCGKLLLDVGIDGMFLDLPKSRRPAGAVDPNDHTTIPAGIETSVVAGSPADPALSYEFNYEPDNATGVASETVTWIDNPKIFVNTGRRPLFGFNYMYDAHCGNTGFQALP